MTDDLVTWDDQGVLAWDEAKGPEPRVLLHAVRGFIDAGQAGAILTRHLLDQATPTRVATFDVDRLLDYRSRRPEMTFSVNAWTEYEEPQLVLDMVRDAAGQPFLILHGLEPDVLWEAYIRAVREVVERLGVTLVVAAHGIPMAAPHTREIRATVHGTRPDLVPSSPSFFSTVAVPASVTNLLEYRFGTLNLAALTVAVHVPHYLTGSAYPQASQEAMRLLAVPTGLDLAPEGLAEAARAADEEIERQVADSDEVQALVEALERQYDAFLESREGVIPFGGRIPTADELGAEFEKFLADRSKDVP